MEENEREKRGALGLGGRISSTVDRKLLIWIMNKFRVLLRKEKAVINN